MAIIHQQRTPDPDAPDWSAAPFVSAITAAASPIPPENWSKVSKATPATAWQDEAWKMVDQVGELAFAMLWKQSLMSRIRLVASDIGPDGLPTGSTENATAKAIVSRIAGGTTGQSQMIARLSPLLTVPGEAWLAIIYPPDQRTGQAVETWLVLSRAEVKARGEQVELLLPDGGKYLMNPETDTIQRIWRQDPNISYLPWSPVKAALPALRRMVRMEQAIEAAGKSRIAGNGILLVPTEVSLPAQAPPTGTPDPAADPPQPAPPPAPVYASAADIRKAIQDAMATAIEDQSSAAAMVPLILMARAEFLKEIRHLRLDTEVSEKAQAALEAATRRLAMSLDMPAEVLLGMADLNHWSLWGIESEAIRWHAAPEMETICDALTKGLLEPLLPDGSEPVVIWYDVSDIESAPDDVEKMAAAFGAGVANSAAYQRALKLGPDDGYDLSTREGMQLWLGDTIRRDPTLIPVLADLIRKVLPDMAVEPAPAPPQLPAGEQPPVVDAEQQGPPDTLNAAARAVVRMCTNEALRRAAKRRRNRFNNQRLRGVADCDIHATLGPITPVEGDPLTLIDGWEEIADSEVLAAAGLSADDLRARVLAGARAVLTASGSPT